MKNSNVKYQFTLFLFLVNSIILSGQTMNIRINQMGYYPEATKIAIVVWSKATDFEVLKVSDSTVVFSGKLSEQKYSKLADDSVKWADFSALKTPGKYFVRVKGFASSLSFDISGNVLRPAAYGSLKSFYYQRCSYELTKEYAGIWARKKGHPDQKCFFAGGTGKNGSKACVGGWYDAGDYGKYVLNSSITVGSMLQLHENFPDCFEDNALYIPESGNGKNDLLDEVKYELDWLKTMQDDDGGVFSKITTEYFADFVMPSDDTSPRCIYGKLTGSTLDFAAMMAMAGRIYVKYDSSYAADCITKAEKAWAWAKQNSKVSNAPGGTGTYPDYDFSDEFLWAAAELFITTNKDEYKTYLKSNKVSLVYKEPSWQDVRGLASLSLATHPGGLDTGTIASINNSIISKANEYVADINNDPYREVNVGYTWGTTTLHANAGICLIYAYLLSKDSSYIKAAAEIADYFLGKNALGYSFFTFYGHKSPMNIHHRISISDGITQPVPGFLMEGNYDSGLSKSDSVYALPEKTYEDVWWNYECNESGISGNGSPMFVLAAVDFVLGDSAQKIDFQPPTGVKNPPLASLYPEGSTIGSTYPLYGGSFKTNDSILMADYSTPDTGIYKVEFYIDNKFLGMKTKAPYLWKFKCLSLGSHIISLDVIDNNELVTEKSEVISLKKSTEISNKITGTDDYMLDVAPNPVSENSIIRFSVPVKGTVSLEVYDAAGKKLASKIMETNAIEENQIDWDKMNVMGKGFYTIVLRQNNTKVASVKAIAIN